MSRDSREAGPAAARMEPSHGRPLRPPPIVSVVMPVHNGAAYVREAIESILAQTFRDVEFIVIDDGSTDDTRAILAGYERADARLRVYSQERRGIAASRNRGCGLAKGKYMAVMDADDISLPRRLEAQVRFLDAHPAVGLCGARAAHIDRAGRPLGRVTPNIYSPARLRWNLLFGNVFVQSSVMMRRGLLPAGDPYRGEMVTEDYDLWVRLAPTTRMVNLPRTLGLYRVHERSNSARVESLIEPAAVKISRRSIAGLLGDEVSPQLVEDLRRVVSWNRLPDQDQRIDRVVDAVRRLYAAYTRQLKPTPKERREVAGEAAMVLAKLASLHVWTRPRASWTALWSALLLDPFLFAILPSRLLERAMAHALSGVSARSLPVR
ncbi:MAG TPA: glycosyltransferase [bacterium]|nr:glycosyltransferase [bacterium]